MTLRVSLNRRYCCIGCDRRCKHGIVDPDWCYDCFYEDDPEDDSL